MESNQIFHLGIINRIITAAVFDFATAAFAAAAFKVGFNNVGFNLTAVCVGRIDRSSDVLKLQHDI